MKAKEKELKVYAELLKSQMGYVVEMEVGHPTRQSSEFLQGCVAGMFYDDSLLALVVWQDFSLPLEEAKPATVDAPAPEVAAPAPPTPISPNAVTPGQPLQGIAKPAEATPPPTVASQSNIGPLKEEMARDFNIRWVDVDTIIYVRTSARIQALTNRNEAKKDIPPNEMFHDLGKPGDVIPDLEGKPLKITRKHRRAWHVGILTRIRDRLDALKLPCSCRISDDRLKIQPFPEDEEEAAKKAPKQKAASATAST